MRTRPVRIPPASGGSLILWGRFLTCVRVFNPDPPTATPLEDYLLVSRVPNSSTGGLILVAAGIKQFGTEAAGHLLTDPALLGSVLSKLPAGWENKNLQVVLHVKVIGNTPAQPDIAALHVW